MAKYIDQEIPHYYDVYPTKEDVMGTHFLHGQLVDYLMEVLKWLLHGQTCALYKDLNFYETTQWAEYPLAPDIALIQGVEQEPVGSWTIGTTGPAPHLVFEIASKKTWEKDLYEKPGSYALIGVEEYFAYDPHTPPFTKGTTNRLSGWHLDKATGHMNPMTLDSDGSLWSPHLESFLVPDGKFLRLYESNGLLRLTEAQAQEKAKLAETKRADAATKRADALAEKLRSLGIDPNQI